MFLIFLAVVVVGVAVCVWLWLEDDPCAAGLPANRIVSVEKMPQPLIKQDWRVDVREINDALTYGWQGLTDAQREVWPEVLAEMEERRRDGYVHKSYTERWRKYQD